MRVEQSLLQKQVEKTKRGMKEKVSTSQIANRILQSAQAVTSTCVGTGDSVLSKFAFPFVVIDEATMTIEPESLIPLMYKCSQLALIGDPQQLSPMISVSGNEDSAEDVSTPSLEYLSTSLFHRLHHVLPAYFLKEQYRMHPKLAEFPSRKFYN